MAEAIQVTGPVVVRVGAEGANLASLSLLGYTRNGAEMSQQGFFLDVPGDEYGGDDGPPIDVQYMGETATIRLELTKWDATVAAEVEARLQGGTGGTPGVPGTLMFGGSVSWRVLLDTTSGDRNFLRCFPREVIELNKGTRFSTLVVVFEAHEGAGGVLWNTDTA
jgi:hypothetical protein